MERDAKPVGLTVEQCWSQLAAATVLRVALTEAALPVIVPVRHTVVGHEVVFGIGGGALLRAALARDVVAVEADGESADRSWSVSAAGRLEIVSDPRRWRQVRPLVRPPWEGGDASHLARIELLRITGAIAPRP